MRMTPFIGIGTGRCGTTSLGHLIAACGPQTIHDKKGYLLSWVHSKSDRRALWKIVSYLRAGGGAISHSYLTHVETFRKRIPGLKVIHIGRPKNEVIRSMLRLRRFNGCPKYRTPFTERWKHETRHLFPRYKMAPVTELLSRYYDEYHERASQIKDMYNMEMAELNDDRRLRKLFDWLEISSGDQVFLRRRQWNKT